MKVATLRFSSTPLAANQWGDDEERNAPNPEQVGLIDVDRAGGWHFYWIENGEGCRCYAADPGNEGTPKNFVEFLGIV